METATTEQATEIRKNASEVIIVKPTVYQDIELIDCRVWSVDPTGEKRPTKKGLCLRPAVWPEVLAAVQGLLPGGESPNGQPVGDDEFGLPDETENIFGDG